ncbi:rab9 effector protein with kelch motifs isoform X3 [Lepus europaeus]|uniref:rab9 effector protein with kelch motifs isoform X3 n=1 Tax=Lepus europaeus TaxID=9983 RepID=UPI002B491EA4|nr:rab9 effector protein with kelch motifs isoform X3 [Lepus europaeus]
MERTSGFGPAGRASCPGMSTPASFPPAFQTVSGCLEVPTSQATEIVYKSWNPAEWTVRETERKVFLCRWFTLQWPPRPAHCGRRTALIRWQEPETRSWTTPEVTSLPPSPRTFHTSSAAIGSQLYVFGGGERGAQPVQDVKLHVFDASMDRQAPQGCHLADTLTWSQPETLGRPPSPRHGHVMVAAGTKLFIHGGLAGDTFYDDLHCIDISDMEWQKLSPTGAVPAGCAAHSAVAVGKHLYVFGGMTPTGALDTMYQYHIENQHWTLLNFDTFLPPGRLDHSMCVIPWPVTSASEREDPVTVHREAEKGNSDDKGMTHCGDSCEESQTDVLLCFVFGGMNTEGEIYDDCIVTVVD